MIFKTDCFVCPRCAGRVPRKANLPVSATPICPACAPQSVQLRRYAVIDLDWPNVVGRDLNPVELANLVARMPPPPPGPPPPVPNIPNLANTASDIYRGSGTAPGRGRVLYRLTYNPAQAMVSVYVDSSALPQQQDATTLRMQFHHGLLTANPPNADTLLKSPVGGDTAWAVLRKSSLAQHNAKAAWNQFPDEVKIGIAVGNPWYGLIHLLSGHATTINSFLASAVGTDNVFRTGEQADRAALNTNGLQALLTVSFAAAGLHSILHAGANKFILVATDHRKLVIDRQGTPIHTLTTMYGASESHVGNTAVVWSIA